MRPALRVSLMSIAVALFASACTPPSEPAAPGADPSAPVPAANAPATWPASLTVMGDGFPGPGDACRKIGESSATVDYLDDSATLVGCLSAADAEVLGGSVVASVDGVTLVSVPSSAAVAGDGDGQGDASVAGTSYNATAQIPCAGYKGAAQGACEAGVMRNPETGASVDVTLPDGSLRTIFFNQDGSFLSFKTAEANGTAGMQSGSSRKGDTTIATLGTERYEIPDAFVKGD